MQWNDWHLLYGAQQHARELQRQAEQARLLGGRRNLRRDLARALGALAARLDPDRAPARSNLA